MRRFQQEAQVLANLDHRNLLTVVDMGWVQGKPFTSACTRPKLLDRFWS